MQVAVDVYGPGRYDRALDRRLEASDARDGRVALVVGNSRLLILDACRNNPLAGSIPRRSVASAAAVLSCQQRRPRSGDRHRLEANASTLPATLITAAEQVELVQPDGI